jgi:hypothetical protein
MGDRGNIVIEDAEQKPILFLYTHWTGSDLPKIVQAALIRGKERWTDPSYLNRILFSELIKNDVLDLTGYGIDVEMGDGGTEVYVCHENQTVRFREKTYSFESFTDVDLTDYPHG